MQHPHQASPQPQDHDVFLSHSGAQRGFVRDLAEKLKSYGFRPFLDVEYHSLPLAESFPQHIFAAASTCKLGLVVLSNEYVSSKWPMLELYTFMHATPPVKVLPIFFLLSPSDLKNTEKREKWYDIWNSFAKLDDRIEVCKWKDALHSLEALNGIVYAGAASEGEMAFIERIVDSICSSRTLAPQSIYDTSYMQGSARLHQIIVDKFGEMESRDREHRTLMQPQEYRAGPSTIPCPRPQTASVLGIYGLPGSGKSTLCRSLQELFFSQYPGRSLYLELPTRCAGSELVDVISRAFNLNTNSATHIDQVMCSLKNQMLGRKSMFLAVDNICDESCEKVLRMLRYVIGPGSRVLLVARTFDLLRPALLVGHEQLNYICDSSPMPSLTEEEATKLLLETSGQGCGNIETHQQELMRQKDEVLRIVRMCGYHSKEHYSTSEFDFSPLMVRAMGARLARYEKDVYGWARDQEKFWSSFNNQELRLYRMDAVHELILESFKESLDAQQRLLFLDVALFIHSIKVSGLDDACSILGAMHGEDAAIIKKQLTDLKRLCFIERVDLYDRVRVHDVYVEFAESLIRKKESELSRWGYLRDQDIPWNATSSKMKLEEEISTDRPVRAMTLEVKEGCETLDLKNLSSLKAVVLTNCRSLVTFRIAGLTSLAILNISGFRECPRLECYDCDLQNVKMLTLKSEVEDVAKKWLQCVSSTYNMQLGRSIMKNYVPAFMNNYVPAFMKQPSSLELAKHMKWLQVLRLENTGIRDLDGMGSCSWPHLQKMVVQEYLLERFRLGSLPTLQSLEFSSCEFKWSPAPSQGNYRRKTVRFSVDGKDLLRGCPALQSVQFCSDLFKNVGLMLPTWGSLHSLTLSEVTSGMELGDVAASACTLRELYISYCEKLERVHFSAGQLPRLTTLYIISCPRVVEVKFGLQALPSLRYLVIESLSEVCVLNGLEELRLLEILHVACCSMLQPNCLSGLVHLETLILRQYVGGYLKLQQRGVGFNSLGFEGLSNLKSSLTVLLDTLHLSSIPARHSLGRVKLKGLKHVRRIEGIECFTNLRMLEISGCPLLKELPSLHALDLRVLEISGCPLLKELPSLHALEEMAYLYIKDCVKLKAVEGCDNMTKLEKLRLDGCISMERLPFKDVYALHSTHPLLESVSFEGCRLAVGTELIVEYLGSRWVKGQSIKLRERIREENMRIEEAILPKVLPKVLRDLRAKYILR